MKNTYKLIGVFWDGKPAADLPAALRPYDPEYLKAGSPPCLFDLAGKRRRVNLSRLLDISGQSDLDSLVDELAGCRSVAVMLYGKPDPIMEDQLTLAGIPYRRYDDFHQLSKKESVYRHTGR